MTRDERTQRAWFLRDVKRGLSAGKLRNRYTLTPPALHRWLAAAGYRYVGRGRGRRAQIELIRDLTAPVVSTPLPGPTADDVLRAFIAQLEAKHGGKVTALTFVPTEPGFALEYAILVTGRVEVVL